MDRISNVVRLVAFSQPGSILLLHNKTSLDGAKLVNKFRMRMGGITNGKVLRPVCGLQHLFLYLREISKIRLEIRRIFEVLILQDHRI